MCRTGEQDVAQWQERMQARSAQVQGEVTDIADQHQGLRQRLTTLEAGVRHAEAVTQHSGEDVESQQEQDQLVQVGLILCVQHFHSHSVPSC